MAIRYNNALVLILDMDIVLLTMVTTRFTSISVFIVSFATILVELHVENTGKVERKEEIMQAFSCAIVAGDMGCSYAMAVMVRTIHG